MHGNRETWKHWRSCKTSHYDTIARAPVHVSRERTQDLRRRLGVYTVTSTLEVRRLLWAEKWLREGTFPVDKRTGAGEATRAVVFGRLSFEKEQAPPSRFVRQILGDLDALRAAACIPPARHPSREQQWWKWLLTVPAKSDHGKARATRAHDLTCEQCGVNVCEANEASRYI